MSSQNYAQGVGQQGITMMARKKDQVAQRLAAIKKAAPNVTHAVVPPPKKREEPDRKPREPVFRPAKIFMNRSDSMRCTVCNVTEDGAYIRLEGAHTLPANVTLKFLQTGVTKNASVVWQTDAEVGLVFSPDETDDGTV